MKLAEDNIFFFWGKGLLLEITIKDFASVSIAFYFECGCDQHDCQVKDALPIICANNIYKKYSLSQLTKLDFP